MIEYSLLEFRFDHFVKSLSSFPFPRRNTHRSIKRLWERIVRLPLIFMTSLWPRSRQPFVDIQLTSPLPWIKSAARISKSCSGVLSGKHGSLGKSTIDAIKSADILTTVPRFRGNTFDHGTATRRSTHAVPSLKNLLKNVWYQ